MQPFCELGTPSQELRVSSVWTTTTAVRMLLDRPTSRPPLFPLPSQSGALGFPPTLAMAAYLRSLWFA